MLTPQNTRVHRKVQSESRLAKIYYRKHMTRDDILSCANTKLNKEIRKKNHLYEYHNETKLLRKSNTFTMVLALISRLQAFQVQYLMWTCVDNISIHVGLYLNASRAHMFWVRANSLACKFIIRMRPNARAWNISFACSWMQIISIPFAMSGVGLGCRKIKLFHFCSASFAVVLYSLGMMFG